MKRLICLLFLLPASTAAAHDTWVETNTSVVRTGDAVYVDLKLGNHGNEHRDFKLASKIDLADCTLEVITPDGDSYDLLPSLVDVGYAPKEGYYTGKYVAAAEGVYAVAHALDTVVNHGRPVRSVKSGKTYFLAGKSLDQVPFGLPGFDRALGHALELVPVANPVAPMGPGQPISVKAIFKGSPLAGARVSFIPRSGELTEGFDDRYERMTDEDGLASFTPKTGDRYLVVVHHRTDESGEGYGETAYSATLTVLVPELCPCCE